MMRWRDAMGLFGAVGLTMVLCSASMAQEVRGRWQGAFKVGEQEAPVILRIEERSPDVISCFANFPSRNADARRCSEFSIEGDVVRFAALEVAGRFAGRITADGAVIDGTWTNTSGTRPLRLQRDTDGTARSTDPARHAVSLIRSTDGTWLEVLDFGGEGPPMLLIPGLGATAHVFDAFTPRLTDKHRVYAVTRRGFGYSDMPAATDAAYSARRLGDDVIAVMDALKLDRPVIVAWSMGGSELSSVATRRPERVSAAIYLEAAYAYAYYAPGNITPRGSNAAIEVNELRAKIRQARASDLRPEAAAELVDAILATDLPQLQAELTTMRDRLRALTPTPSTAGAAPNPAMMRVSEAIGANIEGFSALKVPVLAIFAHPPPAQGGGAERANAAFVQVQTKDQIARFRAGNPAARVVELENADHAVFRSNPDEVLREIDAFLEGLGRP